MDSQDKNMRNKNDHLDDLFKEWRNQYSPAENFVLDGIIDEEKYEEAEIKVLFITKEPNDPNQEATDYRKWWKEELLYTFSYRIAEWSYGILNEFPLYDTIWPKKGGKYDDTIALNAIQSIAFMNIKKSGGIGTSKESEINKYIERDWNYIHEQIKIINPEIIVMGMSWASSVNLLFPKLEFVQSGYAIEIGKFGRSKIIDFYHPSARNGVAASYSLLQNIIQSDAFKSL